MKIFFSRFFLRSISLYLLSIRMDIESNSLEFEKFLNLIFSKTKIRMKKFHSTFSRTWNYIYIYHSIDHNAIESVKKILESNYINTCILNIKIYLILESLNHHPLYSPFFAQCLRRHRPIKERKPRTVTSFNNLTL